MKIIQTNGLGNLTELEYSGGWYWCCDYARGDLYEAEELFRSGHPVQQNRLVFVHCPDGRVVEPIRAGAGQYFGAPAFENGKLQILMVDFPQAAIRIFQHDPRSGQTALRAELALAQVEDCAGGAACTLASEEEVAAAQEAGLPYGKYRAFLELQALDPSLTPEDVAGMTMKEIRAWIDELAGEDTGEGTASGQGQGNGQGQGSGQGQGNGRGQGNGQGKGKGKS